jgi:isocitrate dehydrogenase
MSTRWRPGDIWRSATAQGARSRTGCTWPSTGRRPTGCEAIFWLDENRAHDAELIAYVKPILEAKGVADKFEIMAPREATRAAGDDHEGREHHRDHRQRAARLPDRPLPDPRTGHLGQDAVDREADAGRRAVRDRRGRLGPQACAAAAGEQNHLRWDSLGEFCALGESFKFLAETKGNAKARMLGEAVEAATQGYLDNDNSPGRKVGQPDNRDSHYWFARYWAEALAAQTEDAELAAHFAPIAKAMAEKEDQIMPN